MGPRSQGCLVVCAVQLQRWGPSGGVRAGVGQACMATPPPLSFTDAHAQPAPLAPSAVSSEGSGDSQHPQKKKTRPPWTFLLCSAWLSLRCATCVRTEIATGAFVSSEERVSRPTLCSIAPLSVPVTHCALAFVCSHLSPEVALNKPATKFLVARPNESRDSSLCQPLSWAQIFWPF